MLNITSFSNNASQTTNSSQNFSISSQEEVIKIDSDLIFQLMEYNNSNATILINPFPFDFELNYSFINMSILGNERIINNTYFFILEASYRCLQGEILSPEAKCFPCPFGTFASDNICLSCPENSFCYQSFVFPQPGFWQDFSGGLHECTPNPEFCLYFRIDILFYTIKIEEDS